MTSAARRMLLAALLVAGAVVWVRINKPVEGRTLVVLTHNHGVTTADLLALIALVMAAVLIWPARRGEQEPETRYIPRVPHPSAPRRADSADPTYGGSTLRPPPPQPRT